jgi:flavin-dependent dehydrogenase
MRDPGGVRVAPARGEAALGRVLVDASGRSAPAGRLLGARRWLAWDRQVALVARVASSDPEPRDLLLEAAEDGFWYSAPQPGGTLVVVLVTDADLVPAGGRASLPRRFGDSLARTTHTAARAAGLTHTHAIRVVRAESGCLLPPRGDGWWAVGDASMASDPLAGNGVPRALRSARDVAASIHRALDGVVDEPPPAELAFAEYLDRRAEYYVREARWQDAPFWARRRPVAWRDAPLTLDPRTMLRAVGDPSPGQVAHVEALLPPRAIAVVIRDLAVARPAHAAMSCLRAIAPLGDRRLLVGLQELVARGVIAIA